jgi:hypothetical protein
MTPPRAANSAAAAMSDASMAVSWMAGLSNASAAPGTIIAARALIRFADLHAMQNGIVAIHNISLLMQQL